MVLNMPFFVSLQWTAAQWFSEKTADYNPITVITKKYQTKGASEVTGKWNYHSEKHNDNNIKIIMMFKQA